MGHGVHPQARWLLAFDASCATCQEVSAAVARVCGDRLEVLPLAHPDVQRWREQALGPDAPWAPTLVKVTDDRAQAWTKGPVLGLRLALRLGPRSVLRVLGALGSLKRAATEAPSRDAGRARFLRLTAGLGAAVGLVLVGRTPAFAVPRSVPARWAEANKARLPQSYDDLTAYPVEYRRAIFGELAPGTRSRLWVEHLDRYRAAHPGLSAQQASVLDRAAQLAAEVPTFSADLAERPDVRQRMKSLDDDALAAFGKEEAAAMLATLGPVGEVDTEVSRALRRDNGVPGCECAYGFNGSCDGTCWGCWTCDNPPRDSWGICGVYSPGCGPLWQYACTGRCDYKTCLSC